MDLAKFPFRQQWLRIASTMVAMFFSPASTPKTGIAASHTSRTLPRHRIKACLFAWCALVVCLPRLDSQTPDAAAGSNQENAAQTGDPGPVTPQAPIPTYPVRGVVLNSVTHQPIARVLVNGQQDAALTDSEGRFELQLPQGTLVLQVQKPGYNTGRETTPQVVEVGPDKPDRTIYLMPDAIITGQVTFSNSDTADGVTVRVGRRTAVDGRNRWVTQQIVTTNSEGNFRATGLQPGAYIVSTELERDQGTSAEGYGYPVLYYPGVADPATAGVLTLTAGQHAQADFNLTRQKFFPVTATVSGGRRVAGTLLQIRDANGREAGGAVRPDPRSGIAELSAPNGNYYLEAYSADTPETGRSGAYARVDFRVAGAPVTDLSLTLLPLRGIPVHVRKQFKTPNGALPGPASPDGNGNPGDENAPLTLTLTPASDEFGEPNNQEGNLTKAKRANDVGSFELASVKQGKYWVTVFPFQGYVSSITSGGADLSREPLVVGPGSATAPIEVTLRDDVATIEGRITRQGTSVSAAGTESESTSPAAYGGSQSELYIYAIPLFPFPGRLVESRTSPLGEFGLGNLAPGSYRVAVFDGPQEIDFHSPEGLAKYSSMGKVVTVEPGGTTSLQLDSSAIGVTEAQ